MTAPRPMEVSLDQLELDPLNPRLPDIYQGQPQAKLIETLAKDYSLAELAQSFVDNGYFREEPLVAVPSSENKYSVVEGNRRLAALRILSSPSLVDELGLGDPWKALAAKWQEVPIPILVYQAREEIVPYLGFRHISGVKQWEPREKARFLNSLLQQTGRSFSEVAREVGSQAGAVRNSYVAYRILCQARDDFEIDTTNLESNFGVLLRALSSSPIKKFLGLVTDGKEPGELEKPIPEGSGPKLRELVEWIFGIGTIRPVLHDSRELTKLGWILDSAPALETLRASGAFQLALARTEGEESSVIDNLQKANYHLEEVKRVVDLHRDNATVKSLVQRCEQMVKSVRLLVNQAPAGE